MYIISIATLALAIISCHIKPIGHKEEPNLVDVDLDNIPNISDSDIDGDGKPNTSDNDIDGDGINNSDDTDVDGDEVANINDTDIDGDGIINTSDTDIDGDGLTNQKDTDIDGDGIANIDDNDLDGDGIENTSDSDLDNDNVSNSSDTDLDNDGIANVNDYDIDGDGIANTSDTDIDNDGTANGDDQTPGGTGNQTDGTLGNTNNGTDKNEGTVNDGTDLDDGETSDDIDVAGIGVVAEDSISFQFIIPPSQGAGVVSQTQQIDLDEVRDGVSDNGIDLGTFGISNLSILAEKSSFTEANSQTRVAVKVSYLDENNNKIAALESADRDGLITPVLTVADLAAGVSLGDEIRGTAEGFTSFATILRDESKPAVTTVIDIIFLEQPKGNGGELDVDFILRATGKKAFE